MYDEWFRHDERLSQFVPKSQIFLVVTMWTAGLCGPGHCY